MKVSLNTIQIKQCGLIEQLDIARRAGYDAVGLWSNNIRSFVDDGHTLSELKDLLDHHQLQVSEVCYLGGWQYTGGLPVIATRAKSGNEDPAELLAGAHKFLEECVVLGAACAVTVCAIQESGDLDEGARDLATLCGIAGPYRVPLAYEFVGFARQMKDIGTAWELVRKSGCSEAGILLDFYHFFWGGSTLEDLARVPTERILLVHVNDAVHKPRKELTNEDRLFPGEGSFPVSELASYLVGHGYDGYLTLEANNQRYWDDDPFKVALEGRKAIDRFLSGVGVKAR